MPNRKDREMKSLHISICWSLKRLKSPVVMFHIHIYCIAPRMSKSTVPSSLEFGQKMTKYGEYWHLHLYSVTLFIYSYCWLFFFCLFEGGWSQLMKISMIWPPSEAMLAEPIRYLLWRLHSWTDLLPQLRCYTAHKRNWTTAIDVVYALKRQGRTLYGFGG